ncbi:glutamate--tRNA ligase [Kosmotoga pacifica]|uniref:Glutamate--tRNA ligase n=1 Tax=Kosmotoga pacifica TaxID=1330330 RepID=A0A0G2Z6J4_9BACT|nr:glutamate--tRNA ligase [Kosmotoga pacifica]AKI97220.1 glutamyl-tRNA synthetase [Kosmotoga pacifica]
MTRVRFAPSPTGHLHVGGARTALFNYLYAKHTDGKFVLRIEDTDIERSTKESEEKLIESLLWLGISWDEGPDIGGPFGPYRQSERKLIYKQMAEQLLREGKAYEVYAYPDEIKALHDKLMAQGKPPHYSEEMFKEFDTPSRRREFEQKGLTPAIFFKIPRKDFAFFDLVKGEVIFKEGSLGDFTIMRSNGLPIYNFAVVVDDMLMEISHVIRGDDHLPNTLKQLALYEAFGVIPPKFAHVSMILGPDGKKLSKRHGATSVEEFRDRGFLPEALVNYLVLLGWSHPDGKEIMTINEMIKEFSVERLNSSAAVFDEAKARWMNGIYIREADTERLTELSIPYIVSSGLMTEEEARSNIKWLRKAIESVKKSVDELSEIPQKLAVYFEEPEPYKISSTDENTKTLIKIFFAMRDAFDVLDSWDHNSVVSTIKKILKEYKPDRKLFYSTLRKILTGKDEGPELVEILFLLGRNKVIDRIEKAVIDQ